MVRLLCQNQFQPCSGGSSPEYQKLDNECLDMKRLSTFNKEMVDREMAERAVQAVAALANNRNFNFNNFSGSDSSCDSDGDHSSLTINDSEDGTSSNDQDDKCLKEQRRKDRRRERNKVSAQAYRQRRRQQNSSQSKVLHDLEEKHQGLLEKVKRLEEEKNFVEDLLKKKINIPWHWTTKPTHPYTVTTGTPTGIIIPPAGIVSPPPKEMMTMTSSTMDTPTMMETEVTMSAS